MKNTTNNDYNWDWYSIGYWDEYNRIDMDDYMNIDVFGGTGFIGSRFCEIYKDETNIHPRENNVPTEKDILYLISTVDNYNVITDLHIDINTNLSKLMSVLENCKDKDITFNYISSWFVYGQQQYLPVNEQAICEPKGFYSITKKCAEDLLISYCKTFDIKYRILRLCNVYGLGDVRKSKKKNALQYLVDEMKLNHDINLYYGGQFIRDYLHVDDICRAIKLCVSRGQINDIINIGCGESLVFRDLINFVAKEIGYTGKITAIDPTNFHRIVQVKNFYMDVRKLSGLGFWPKITIENGLRTLL